MKNIIIYILMLISLPVCAQQDARLGIYLENEGKYTKIFPSIFSNNSVNTIGAALTFGLASADVVFAIQGESSHNEIKTYTPQFHFFFSKNPQSTGNIFHLASSPYEFILVRLNKEDNMRKIRIGSANVYSGQKTGISNETIIPTRTIILNDWEFIVTPKEPLDSGEYGFFYLGNVNGNINQSVYDFSIPSVMTVTPKYKIGDTVWIKSFLMPSSAQIVDFYEYKGVIVYITKYQQTGIIEEHYEYDCHSSSQEAKNHKKPKYEELEKSFIKTKYELERKIEEQNMYIETLKKEVKH